MAPHLKSLLFVGGDFFLFFAVPPASGDSPQRVVFVIFSSLPVRWAIKKTCPRKEQAFE